MSLNKFTFKSLIAGIELKLIGREDAKEQLSIIQRMDSFLERLTYVNCISVFQAKLIKSQEMRIILLEQGKTDLILVNEDLKTRSIVKITELEKELNNIKKRIKNDKESS